MKHSHPIIRSALTALLSALMLFCSAGAHATAPRIAPQLFGEEKKAEVVGYQFFGRGTADAGNAMIAELVRAAFEAGGQKPSVDMLPSRQLARYALLSGDAVALVCSLSDLHEKERKQHWIATFYFNGGSTEAEQVVLACNRQNPRGTALCKAFSRGLQVIVKNGKYREIIEKHMGAGAVPADIQQLLRQHNPDWK